MTKPRRKIGSEILVGIRQLNRGRSGRVTEVVSAEPGHSGKRRRTSRFDFSEGVRGAVDPPSGRKTRIALSVDTDILDWFRRAAHEMGGGNYALMMSEALRRHVTDKSESVEDVLRRVIREELSPRRAPRKPRAKG